MQLSWDQERGQIVELPFTSHTPLGHQKNFKQPQVIKRLLQMQVQYSLLSLTQKTAWMSRPQRLLSMSPTCL